MTFTLCSHLPFTREWRLRVGLEIDEISIIFQLERKIDEGIEFHNFLNLIFMKKCSTEATVFNYFQSIRNATRRRCRKENSE